jgi:hypothetical protein
LGDVQSSDFVRSVRREAEEVRPVSMRPERSDAGNWTIYDSTSGEANICDAWIEDGSHIWLDTKDITSMQDYASTEETNAGSGGHAVVFNKRKALLQEVALAAGDSKIGHACFENFGKILCHFLLSPPPRKKLPGLRSSQRLRSSQPPNTEGNLVLEIKTTKHGTYKPICGSVVNKTLASEYNEIMVDMCRDLGFVDFDELTTTIPLGAENKQPCIHFEAEDFYKSYPEVSINKTSSKDSKVLMVKCNTPMRPPFICRKDLEDFHRTCITTISKSLANDLGSVFNFNSTGKWDSVLDAMDTQMDAYKSGKKCSSLDDLHFDDARVMGALALSCPQHLVENTNVAAYPSTGYCVGKCPSALYDSHALGQEALWFIYVTVGLFSFATNFTAMVIHSFDKKPPPQLQSAGDHSTPLLLYISVVSGVIGPLFLAVFGNELQCKCPSEPHSELCIREDLVGFLGRMNIFVLLAVLFCMCLKFVGLLGRMIDPHMVRHFFERRAPLQVSWLIPLVLSLVSLGLEPHNGDPEVTAYNALYLARTSFLPQIRFDPSFGFGVEFVLLHLPMSICAAAFSYLSVSAAKIFSSVMLLQYAKRDFRTFQKVLYAKPLLRKIFLISAAAVLLLVIWVATCAVSFYLLQDLPEDLEARLKLCRNEISMLAAQYENDAAVSMSSGCEDMLDTYRGLVTPLQALRVTFETIVPLIVVAFSGRIVYETAIFRLPAGITTYFTGTKKGTKVNVQSVAPFCSTAYDHESNATT